MCVYVFVCRQEEGIRVHVTGITGAGKPPDVDAGSQTWVLCKRGDALLSEPSLQPQENIVRLKCPTHPWPMHRNKRTVL